MTQNSTNNTSDETDPFKFELDGFRKLSPAFFLFGIISLVLSMFGLMYIIMFPVLIFLLFPKIYKWRIFQGFSRKLIRFLASKWGNRLSLIPSVNLKGKWFMEYNSEKKEFKSLKSVFSFIVSNWLDFFLIPIGFLLVQVRILTALGLWDYSTQVTDFIDFLFANDMIFLLLVFFPVFYAFYFNTVFVWQDAEIKVADWQKSSKGSALEIKELFTASKSLRNLISLFAGFSALQWVVTVENEFGTDADIGTAIAYALGLFVLIGGPIIFQGIMFYRSGIYEEIVNDFRADIYTNYYNLAQNSDKIDAENVISILSTHAIPVEFDESKIKSNYGKDETSKSQIPRVD